MELQAVVFDLGHTIVDFGPAEEALLATYTEVLESLTDTVIAQRPSAEAMVHGITHRLFDEVNASYEREELEEVDVLAMFDRALGDLGLHLDADTIHRIAVLEHRALASGEVLPPDNLDTLRTLKSRGLRLGLVSNVHLLPYMMREDLEKLDLLPLFDVTVLSSEEMVRKPHPRIYEAVLTRLGVAGAATVFVGDRLKEDVRGPKAAGMRAVLTTQFRQEDPATATVAPDAVIARLAELPAVLDRWIAEQAPRVGA